jgi:hypothetical protein
VCALPKLGLCSGRNRVVSGDKRGPERVGQKQNPYKSNVPKSGALSEDLTDAQFFHGNGRLAVSVDTLTSLVGSDDFDINRFVKRNMAQLSGGGFETARGELEKVMENISCQASLLRVPCHLYTNRFNWCRNIRCCSARMSARLLSTQWHVNIGIRCRQPTDEMCRKQWAAGWPSCCAM